VAGSFRSRTGRYTEPKHGRLSRLRYCDLGATILRQAWHVPLDVIGGASPWPTGDINQFAAIVPYGTSQFCLFVARRALIPLESGQGQTCFNFLISATRARGGSLPSSPPSFHRNGLRSHRTGSLSECDRHSVREGIVGRNGRLLRRINAPLRARNRCRHRRSGPFPLKPHCHLLHVKD
jgi:hypothetical protein